MCMTTGADETIVGTDSERLIDHRAADVTNDYDLGLKAHVTTVIFPAICGENVGHGCGT